MCCFSLPIKHVSKTEIFAGEARAPAAATTEQFLVYKMSVQLDEELAMILPLPVPPGCGDDVVGFLDLSGYDGFFQDLARGFPERLLYAKSRSLVPSRGPARPMLQVHSVGAFEASFVPSVGDFDRLDPRFRLPRETWASLPAYADYGFAVFKLRRKAGLGGLWQSLRGKKQSFHPMALRFPRRDPSALFFPTVHIHDGKVYGQADFDHTLYCQLPAGWATPSDWERSTQPLKGFADPRRSLGILDGEAPCWRLVLEGTRTNRDTLVHRSGAPGSPT